MSEDTGIVEFGERRARDHSARRRASRILSLVLLAYCCVGASTAAAAIPMQLPFPVGQVWQANGPHPHNGSTGVRNSVDLGRADGSTGTVVAAAAGTVSMVRSCGSGGFEIRIDHAAGWQTGYYHLSSTSVAQGTSVSMGQTIGATGQACGATFRHVHFSLRQNGSDASLDGLNIGGNTLHADPGNYHGFWTRNSDGVRVAEDVGGEARCCLTSLPVGAPGGGSGAGRRFMADVDGDGRSDLVIYNASDASWWVAQSSGSGFYPPRSWASGRRAGSTNQFVADVNGDGKADVITFFGATGEWLVGTSSGSGFWAETSWAYGHGTASSNQFVGDVDGDRRADEIVFWNSTGRWYVGTSSGSGFWPENEWAYGHGTGSSNQFVADVDGDRRADEIVSWSSTGSWWVGTSSGSGFWPESQWAYGPAYGG